MSCGTALSLACPNCGTASPPDARFCSNCGHQFGEPPTPAVTEPESEASHLHQYIPKELLSKLEAARAHGGMEGERRIVTMLFCDVKGSTAAAERLDPEEWHEIMNGAFEHLIAPVYRYEGTLARLMGDAILAFFGAPIAHEDDPVRALLAALDILEDIKSYREEVRRDWGLDIDVRIGINTGLVVVGEVGSDLRMEYTAMGDAINLAARMEQTTEPGTIQITDDTYRLVAPLFDTQVLEPVTVKGKTEPVEAHRVLGRKADAGRLRGIEGLEAPLVGRASETELIEQVVDKLSQGLGGVMFLVGEAGLGKSRLIDEAKVRFQGTGKGQWLETASLSYETTQPYALFQRLIRNASGMIDTDAAEDVVRKIGSLTLDLTDDVATQAESVLATLMRVLASDDAPIEGETFKGLLFSTMQSLWRMLASDTPAVLVFDDLHWADRASVELLVHLLQLVDEVPILFLCAMRPESTVPGWQVRQEAESGYGHTYTEISLHPLSENDSNELVDGLLTIADLPKSLRNQILDKSEGNPFFIEEVVRTLIDSGSVVRTADGSSWVAQASVVETDVPDNLQALLSARIDRLEDSVRRTLQIASVIGRSFHQRVLVGIGRTRRQPRCATRRSPARWSRNSHIPNS